MRLGSLESALVSLAGLSLVVRALSRVARVSPGRPRCHESQVMVTANLNQSGLEAQAACPKLGSTESA